MIFANIQAYYKVRDNAPCTDGICRYQNSSKNQQCDCHHGCAQDVANGVQLSCMDKICRYPECAPSG